MIQILTIILISIIRLIASQYDNARSIGQFVDISARGNEIWTIDRYGGVFRYDRSRSIWRPIPNTVSAGVMNGKPKQVAASPDGWTWMITDATPFTVNNVYRYNDNSHVWELEAPGWASQVSAVSKDMVSIVGSDSANYQWTGGPYFQKLVLDMVGAIKWVTVCDGGEKWVVDTKGLLYRYDNDTKKFNKMPGCNIANLDCQNEDRVVATTDSGRMYMWNKKTWIQKSWIQIPGHGSRVTITKDHLFVVNEMENTYQLGLDEQANNTVYNNYCNYKF